MENLQIKNSDIFHSSAQNIDCGYSFTPVNPQFHIMKVRFKGVKIKKACFRKNRNSTESYGAS